MSFNDATPTGNAQLDGLFTLMRAPVPQLQAERAQTFAAVRKSIGELQANLHLLTGPQVQRLHAAIAEYETKTQAVHVEIHADLTTLRQQVGAAHPGVITSTAPAAAGNAPPPPERPMTMQEYENSLYPDPSQRTGLGWKLRWIGFALHRIGFGVGKMFRRRPAGNPPPNQPAGGTQAETNPGAATNIETLPPVNGQPQNLLQLANRGTLQLGDQRLSIIRAGTGPNEKYLFDIGTKRYELVIDDYAYEGGPVAPLNVSREFVSNERVATTAIRFENGNMVLIGEANIPLKGAVGGRTHIPRAQFITMIQEVVKQQAAGTNPVRFDNVSVRYTGRIQTTAGNPVFATHRGPVDQARVIPSIRFVEVPRT